MTQEATQGCRLRGVGGSPEACSDVGEIQQRGGPKGPITLKVSCNVTYT